MKKNRFYFCFIAMLLSIAGIAQAGSTVLASASDSRSYTQGCSPQLTDSDSGTVTSSHLNSYCSGGPCEIKLIAVVDNECCREVSVIVYKIAGGSDISVIFDDDFAVCSNGSSNDSISTVIDTDADADDDYLVWIDEGGATSCSSTCEQEDTTITAQLRVGIF